MITWPHSANWRIDNKLWKSGSWSSFIYQPHAENKLGYTESKTTQQNSIDNSQLFCANLASQLRQRRGRTSNSNWCRPEMHISSAYIWGVLINNLRNLTFIKLNFIDCIDNRNALHRSRHFWDFWTSSLQFYEKPVFENFIIKCQSANLWGLCSKWKKLRWKSFNRYFSKLFEHRRRPHTLWATVASSRQWNKRRKRITIQEKRLHSKEFFERKEWKSSLCHIHIATVNYFTTYG